MAIDGMAFAAGGRISQAAPRILVHKDPNCGCCSGWVEHVRSAGFDTHLNELSDLAPIKSRLAVPPALSSCHTAEVDGYVIEGPCARVCPPPAPRGAAVGYRACGPRHARRVGGDGNVRNSG